MSTHSRRGRSARWAAACGIVLIVGTASPALASGVGYPSSVAPGGTVTVNGDCDQPANEVRLVAEYVNQSQGPGTYDSETYSSSLQPGQTFSITFPLTHLDDPSNTTPPDYVWIHDVECLSVVGEVENVVGTPLTNGEIPITGSDPEPNPDPEPDPEPEPDSASDPAPATPAERGSPFATGVEVQAAHDSSVPTAVTVLGCAAAVSGAMVLWTARRRAQS